MKKTVRFFAILPVIALFSFVSMAEASHSWANYHWARTANPFTLKLGDNVTPAWDSFLTTASTKWNASVVLETNVVAGLTNPKNCKAVLGRIEICNSKYGNNGWLGIAQIWINGSHITQGVAKMNDTYFSTKNYNKPAWRNMVMCQEVAHAFGLDHQDENFSNTNLGTCMDYSNDPARNDGLGDNQYPNVHDFEQLEIIYSHLDSTTTIGATTSTKGVNGLDINFENPSDWGKSIRTDGRGRDNMFLKDLGKGEKVITHVFWAE